MDDVNSPNMEIVIRRKEEEVRRSATTTVANLVIVVAVNVRYQKPEEDAEEQKIK